MPAPIVLPDAPRAVLVEELRAHALILGDVVLSSGATASYYVDSKRATLLPRGYAAMGELVAHVVRAVGATAVGGLTMGADPVACSALAGGSDASAFLIRKETKAHGLQRRVEGPLLGDDARCLVVEDVVTTGGSTLQAVDALRAEGREIVGVLTVLDRLVGGADRIREAVGAEVPYVALTTIDDVHPERPTGA